MKIKQFLFLLIIFSLIVVNSTYLMECDSTTDSINTTAINRKFMNYVVCLNVLLFFPVKCDPMIDNMDAIAVDHIVMNYINKKKDQKEVINRIITNYIKKEKYLELENKKDLEQDRVDSVRREFGILVAVEDKFSKEHRKFKSYKDTITTLWKVESDLGKAKGSYLSIRPSYNGQLKSKHRTDVDEFNYRVFPAALSSDCTLIAFYNTLFRTPKTESGFAELYFTDEKSFINIFSVKSGKELIRFELCRNEAAKKIDKAAKNVDKVLTEMLERKSAPAVFAHMAFDDDNDNLFLKFMDGVVYRLDLFGKLTNRKYDINKV